MDPLTLFSVFYKFALFSTDNSKINISIYKNPSRTEIIELYRNEMQKKNLKQKVIK